MRAMGVCENNPDPVRSMPLADLLSYAEGVGQTVSVARGLVDAGRVVDLGGLEDQIGLLCAKALDLPRDDGRAIKGELVALLARVDGLSAALLRARHGG